MALTPDYLDTLPDALVELWRTVEDDILRDVARRIAKMDGMTSTAQWQLWRLSQTRALHTDVVTLLARYSGKSNAVIRKLLREAGTEALASDDALYKALGFALSDVNTNPALRNLLQAGYRQTLGTWKNLTATTARTVTQQFENELSRAWLQVSSGAFDYKTAIKRAVDTLAQHMDGVTYPSGHKDTLEVACRRAALTGVNQTAAKLQLARAEEMGCEFVEVTAHAGARPDHALWQGKVYHRGGAITYQGKRYADFEEATGYGTGAGLCGWNCRHNFYPFFPGLSKRAYVADELEALNAKTEHYNGKLYTKYEVSQMRRALERKVRSAKKQFLAEDAAGLDTSGAAAKLGNARRALNGFVRDTGGKVDGSRTGVSGFGRSAAEKAAYKAKSIFAKPENSATINPIQNVGSERKIEATILGNLKTSPLEKVFGPLRTSETIVTDERASHIKDRHPEDYALFLQYGKETIEHPDLLVQDTKHTGTIFAVKKLENTNLNVVIRLVLETDNPDYKNSVMTFYRIREKNLTKLVEKHNLLYKKE